MGNGKFKLHALPALAQMAPIMGIVTDDFNNDGNLDILFSGNDFGNEVTDGRYDAMNGLVLSGDGKGNFMRNQLYKVAFLFPGMQGH
jgi:hypothetical protein